MAGEAEFIKQQEEEAREALAAARAVRYCMFHKYQHSNCKIVHKSENNDFRANTNKGPLQGHPSFGEFLILPILSSFPDDFIFLFISPQ